MCAAVLLLLAVLLPPPPAAAAACPASSGGTLPSHPTLDDDIVFNGRGWGHGTGMSQYAARGAAALGCGYDDILSTYFPGTTLTERAAEGFRVSFSAATLKTTITNDGGAAVGWQVCPPGGACSYAHWQPAGSTWIARVVQDPSTQTAAILVQRNDGGGWTTVARHGEDETVRVVLSSVNDDTVSRAVTVDTHDSGPNRRIARGVLELDPIENGTDTTFVTLLIGMEQYLYGLGEIPTSWPVESLRAQVVAARSYAYQRIDSRTQTPQGLTACRCHLYATMRDQNYVGYAKETEGTNAVYGKKWVEAVRSTHDQILQHDGAVIPAFYSSLHGGASESYAFWSGGSDRPYLQAVDDSAWEAAGDAPLSAWSLGVSAERLGSLLGIGVVTDVQLPAPQGLRGRVGIPPNYGGVVVKGTTGEWRGSGDQFKTKLKGLGNDCWDRTSAGEVQRLCSTMYSVRLNLGPQPVPPPAGATLLTGDWDGDGVDTPGWFKDGQWGLHDSNSGTGGTQRLAYGRAGDTPVVGDWNGDGTDTIGVVRGNTWILRYEYRSGADIVMRYGRATDTPVTGDWNGDGTDTIGVVRGNTFYLRYEYRSGADIVLDYGRDTDTPVTGDWNGDGIDTLGVVRGNRFILRYEYRSGADIVLDYGRASDVKVTGDWNGDGTDTLGVVRGDTWFLRYEYRRGADYIFDY